jgi:signal transduction histidine kinase
LARCLQNLIGNAAKYGGDQRWVGIRAWMAEGSNGGNEICISVADRGIGIRPEDLGHIFEPFYRASEVTEAQIHGTGLGLPLAKKIAQALGGTITVASEFGKGSTFTLHLPLH